MTMNAPLSYSHKIIKVVFAKKSETAPTIPHFIKAVSYTHLQSAFEQLCVKSALQVKHDPSHFSSPPLFFRAEKSPPGRKASQRVMDAEPSERGCDHMS